jgi:hypothetical protein
MGQQPSLPGAPTNFLWSCKGNQYNRKWRHVFRRDQSGDSLNDEYEYALKWKIHDTLGSLGSLEDTFTQVYVCTTWKKFIIMIIIISFEIDPGICKTIIAAVSNNFMIVWMMNIPEVLFWNKEEFGFLNGFTFFFLFFFDFLWY